MESEKEKNPMAEAEQMKAEALALAALVVTKPLDKSVCPWCGKSIGGGALSRHMMRCHFNPVIEGCGSCGLARMKKNANYPDFKALWSFECPKGYLDSCRTKMIWCPDWKMMIVKTPEETVKEEKVAI